MKLQTIFALEEETGKKDWQLICEAQAWVTHTIDKVFPSDLKLKVPQEISGDSCAHAHPLTTVSCTLQGSLCYCIHFYGPSDALLR